MKWTSLRHNGVAFPPPYEYRGLVVRIKDKSIQLTADQEEMLLAWAKKKDTPYVEDPVFQRNFINDLANKLGPEFKGITLADIDLTELHAIADHEKTANLSDEEKKRRSAERKRVREELKTKFGTAVVDGHVTEVGAYLVEPPGILMGRGNHPLRGRWKDRIRPEEVTLNLDADAPTPEGQWKEIVHEHDSMWLASWYDKLSDKRKYIWLADSSHLRQERDREKYLKAAKLESELVRVREEIGKRMSYQDSHARASLSKQRKQCDAKRKTLETRLAEAAAVGDSETRKKVEDERSQVDKEIERLDKRQDQIAAHEMKTRQLATVCYLIDRLAMRVGDEKDEDEADTVGASTLRVEHVRIGRDSIEFDFLGKDSVQWTKSLALAGDDLVLARNLQDLTHGKQTGDQIFDKIDSTHVNQFLGSIVPGLTAKVFRTYHATKAVRSFLQQQPPFENDTPVHVKEYVAKLANLEAAVVCNHKRTPPKNWEQNLLKRELEVEKLRSAMPDLKKLEAQIPAREQSFHKLMSLKIDPEKLAAQVKAREGALDKLRVSYAALPGLDERIKAHQATLEKLVLEQKRIDLAAQALLKKTQAALAAEESAQPPNGKQALAARTKRLQSARKALTVAKRSTQARLKKIKGKVAQARKTLEGAEKAKRDRTRRLSKRIAQAQVALARAKKAAASEPQRHAERLAKAQESLERVRQAPALAQRNYQARVEKASLQLDLAKRTRDYNLGTSLKNYIDPSVYKAWGDQVGYDWKRLYTKALQRKFAWVEHVHAKWKTNLKAS